jgi:hypothetical protein
MLGGIRWLGQRLVRGWVFDHYKQEKLTDTRTVTFTTDLRSVSGVEEYEGVCMLWVMHILMSIV